MKMDAFHIDGKNYSGTDIDNLSDIKKTKSNTKETYNVAYIGTPILTEKIQDLNQFYSLLKTIPLQITR
jgi:hypothetical protein